MEKALLLKVLKISVLVLVLVGFFLPFVLMTVNVPLPSMGDHVFSLLNARDLPTKLGKPQGDSALIYMILFLVVAGLAAANMFVKEEYSRISYLASLVVGLIILVLAYNKVFNDAELKAAADAGTVTLSLGFGFILQIVLLVVGGALEFLGKKLLKVE